MRKLRVFIPVAILAVLSLSMIRCKPEKDCECCKFEPIEREYDGKKIKLYTAFTPINTRFCDSIEYLPDGRQDLSRCRENLDSVYNDNLNAYFHIDGIESFPENRLIIRVPGDTTKLVTIENYSNTNIKQDGTSTDQFNGMSRDSTLWGRERRRLLSERKFEYILELYHSSKHTRDNLIDSIHGYVCIIRTKDFDNKGCVAKDANDPLIK